VADARIRVRIAIHQGLIFLASRNGFVGAAVVTAARLVDAPVFKTAFGAFPDATVGCIVSDGLYQDLVAPRDLGIRPEWFCRIEVRLPDKGFAAPAWIQVVGEDVTEEIRLGPPGGVSVSDVANFHGHVAIRNDAGARGSAPEATR
jgi:hypothetical protein